MPLARISLRAGKSKPYLTALRDGIYRAMRDSFDVPENDRFILIHQHADEAFDVDRSYLGIERSDEVVIAHVTCKQGRDVAAKQAFYRRVVERWGDDPGVRPQDVMIVPTETRAEDWSFGNGVAQYV